MYESTRFVGIVRREVPRPSEGDRLIVKPDVEMSREVVIAIESRPRDVSAVIMCSRRAG
jgi:hypothetical protein